MKKNSPINDNRIRVIMIPFFGIVIPNLTGLFGYIIDYTSYMYWIGYEKASQFKKWIAR